MKLLLFILVVELQLVSFCVTITNRTDVVFECLEQLACEDDDHFDDNNMTQDVSWVSWTKEGFFGRMSEDSGERELYQQAFDEVVERFATNDWNVVDKDGAPISKIELARICLCQVRDMCYTNALPSIRRWVLNPKAPHRDMALSLYYRWASLNHDSLSIANAMLTNSVSLSRNERVETYWGLTEAIRNHVKRVGKDECYTNAMKLIYRTRYANIDSAVGLDNFYVSEIDGYEFSSNRLETITEWLAAGKSIPEITAHCISISNKLMNTSTPLRLVDALQGL